ncbi:MAG: hypothetical protein J6T37_08320 [Bacteroidales bacterium]|nr:hypothetical protein [Bacteroidales bacterium]
MLPSFCRTTVTRIRPGTKTLRGSTVPDWSAGNVNTKTISGCSMQPASTSLSEDGRVLGISDLYTLFAPPDADIRAGDRIEYDGKTYEIDGDVRIQPAAQFLEHIEITLRRYSG